MRWIVSVPVWGCEYTATFLSLAWPALLCAVRQLEEPVHLVIHSDRLEDFNAAGDPDGQLTVERRAVARKPTYVTLQESHAETVDLAEPGDRVVLLNADLVVSGNLLAACRRHFDDGYLAVVTLGVRTARGDDAPPAGAPPRDLLSWAWAHRHQIIRDLEWPEGGSLLPTNLFFSAGDDVVARGFHLHPVAVVKQADTVTRSTIDNDLLDCFPRDCIHVVTDPDDCAMLEVSPADRRFPVRDMRLSAKRVARSMEKRASATHKWLLTHRIVVRGTGAAVTEDERVVRDILHAMQCPDLPATAPPRPQRGLEPGGKRGRVPRLLGSVVGNPADAKPPER